MTDAPTFLTLIDRLTRETHTFIDRDHGAELATRPPLLQQLRDAVYGGMEGGSGGTFGSRPPIDPSAVDLLEEITAQAAEVLAAVDPRPTPYGHPEQYIRLWAGQAKEAQVFTFSSRRTANTDDPTKPRVYLHRDEATAYTLATMWVQRIEDFFDPPRPREIAAECPQCENRYVYRDSEGETIRAAALNFHRTREGVTTSAKCAVCLAVWMPDQFEYLARLIGATPLPELDKQEA